MKHNSMYFQATKHLFVSLFVFFLIFLYKKMLKCRYFIFWGRFLFKEGVVLLNNEMDLYFILKKGILFLSDIDLPLASAATVNCHDVTSSF